MQTNRNILRQIYSLPSAHLPTTPALTLASEVRTLIKHPNLPTRRRFGYPMPIIVQQHPLVLCLPAEVDAEFLGLFGGGVDVLFVKIEDDI